MDKRMLFLTGRLPYPLDDGWKIRTFHLLRGMAERGFAVDLLTYVAPEQERCLPEELRRYCREIYAVPRTKAYAPADVAKGLATRTPLPVLNYYLPAMMKKATEVIARNRYELIQVEDIVMCQYLPDDCGAVTALDMHNVESTLMQRYAKNERAVLKKVYARVTARKLRSYETAKSCAFDAIFVCSDEDEAQLRKQGVTGRIEVVPNGVDCLYYELPASKEDDNKVVFVGSMDYHANISGAVFFVREVFPLLLRQQPDAVLYIVGKNPTTSVKELAADNVVVTGAVEDVRSYLAEAGVVIVPLLVGGGTRLKILEAMAMGKAVVSTRLGCEGIPVTNGDNILLADAAGGFADKVALLMNDLELRRRLGSSAQRFIRNAYDWTHITSRMVSAYKECLAGAQKRRV